MFVSRLHPEPVQPWSQAHPSHVQTPFPEHHDGHNSTCWRIVRSKQPGDASEVGVAVTEGVNEGVMEGDAVPEAVTLDVGLKEPVWLGVTLEEAVIVAEPLGVLLKL